MDIFHGAPSRPLLVRVAVLAGPCVAQFSSSRLLGPVGDAVSMELEPTGVVGQVVHDYEQKRPKSLEQLGEPKT